MAKEVKNIISSELGKLNLHDFYRIAFYTIIGFVVFFFVNLGLQVYTLIKINAQSFDILEMLRTAFLFAVDVAKYIAIATGFGKWITGAKYVILTEKK